MPTVSCPSCDEIVRLPTYRLPSGCSVQCPWCNEVLSGPQWQAKLPPMAVVLSADGSPIQWDSQEATRPEDSVSSVIAAAEQLDVAESDGSESVDSGSIAETVDFDESPDLSDLEDTIDLDETPAPPGHSIVAAVEDHVDDAPSKGPTSIDEIEQAWETPQGWESQESIADDAAFDDDGDDFDDDDHGVDNDDVDGPVRRTVADDSESASPHRQRVPVAEDQRSYYERHQWGRKPHDTIRWLKIASPSLLALPVIGTILYFADIDLGFYPFNGAREEPVSQAPPRHSTSLGSQPNQNDAAPVGRVLVDSDQTVEPDRFEPRSGEAMDSGEVDSDAASVDLASGDDSEYSTSEIVAGLFRPDRESGSNQIDDVEDVDEVIRSLVEDGNTLADEPDEATGDESPVTIAMRAREQFNRRNPEPELDAVEREAALLNSATLAFPENAPSADSILQASAQAEIAADPEMSVDPGPSLDPEMTINRESTPDPEMTFAPAMTSDPEMNRESKENDDPVMDSGPQIPVQPTLTEQFELPPEPEPAAALEPAAEPEPTPEPEPAAKPEMVAELDLPTEPEPNSEPELNSEPERAADLSESGIERPDAASPSLAVVESPELIAGCEHAVESLRRLASVDSAEASASEMLVARLRAYRSVSTIGSMDISDQSPAVEQMFTELIRSDAIDQLSPLCGEWVGWGGRKTDGMLLIGEIVEQDGGTFLELADRTRFEIQWTDEFRLPSGTRCAALGSILRSQDQPLIRLAAGVSLP